MSDQPTPTPDEQPVTALYERWVKAGPPPLGVSLARWWDRRLVELRDAIGRRNTPAATEATVPEIVAALRERRHPIRQYPDERREAAERDMLRVFPPETDSQPLVIRYRNWRGETANRTIVPIRVWYGATEWHPEPQWLMRAVDVAKQAERDFAITDMQGGASCSPAAPETEPNNPARTTADNPPTSSEAAP